MDATTHEHENPTGTREPGDDESAGAEEDYREPEPEQAEPRRNLLERLRQRRAENAEAVTSGQRKLIIPVPQFGEELFMEFTYHPSAYDRLKEIGKRAMKSRNPKRELHVAIDTLLFACTDILVPIEKDGRVPDDFDFRNPDHTESINASGEAVGFNDPLPELLGFESPKKAREIVSKVFNNDLAIMAVADKVGKWMQGEEEDADEDFS